MIWVRDHAHARPNPAGASVVNQRPLVADAEWSVRNGVYSGQTWRGLSSKNDEDDQRTKMTRATGEQK